MKRFILSTLAVTVFFLGLGSLVERTGAKFKSDDKALALIAKARIALGGDAAITNIQSMRVLGRTTKSFKVNGVDQSHMGETEIAMQFPDKIMRAVKIGDGTGVKVLIHDMKVSMEEPKGEFRIRTDAPPLADGSHKKIVIKKPDGTQQVLLDAEADKWIAEHPEAAGDRRLVIRKDVSELPGTADRVFIRKHADGDKDLALKEGQPFQVIIDEDAHGKGHIGRNELVRFTLGLLLTAPQGADVEYTSGGEANLDGTNCNVVLASFGASTYKLFLDAASNLPVAMNYTGVQMPRLVHFDRETGPAERSKDAVHFKKEVAHDPVEFQVRFSDYRSVNGVQLPFRWVQTAAGVADEMFEATSFEINPVNIAEKFQQPRAPMRMRKPAVQ